MLRCEQLSEKNVSWFYFLDENHDKQWLDREHQKDVVLCKSERPGYITVIDNGQSSDIRSHHVVSMMFFYRDVSGDQTYYGNQSDILHPSDLEVIYVGQSFKGIQCRLEKHEKIKEIALRVVEESTTEELLVICLAYKANDNAVAFVAAETQVDAGVDSLMKLRGDAGKRISPKKQLTLFEASLIKYFQPEFNTEYKETFPAAGFTSYDEIYDTEFKYVSMAVAMPDNLFVRLWS
ncbi:hypothetical protein IM793_22985 [Pedobacter sp. MR2016-19]|uniref:hypothetical protein n=1 Tax=Pedobacter sp. MR2016-19 TaxID=2780089 RepID=UPI001874EE25|nr:hypothetical protein [Pedobacter sp. MR2016-19]MBE5322039.1 hypothetical protein [Pedobacter sp. MR2016-19]